MNQLLVQHPLTLPSVGDTVEGVVISAENNEVYIDLNGIASGVVRGPELVDESGMFTNLQPGDAVSATVVEPENELGVMELSFREAGHQKAWQELDRKFRDQEVVEGVIMDANKGGLIVKFGNVSGFLPVSQLTVEHYPRVEGANKQKILERLQTYVGQKFQLCILDIDEAENKLIFSEKAAREDEQSELLSQYTVGTTVEGKVTGVVDFGAFVEFGEGLEGLVHISELAWQRIDDPKDIITVGDVVKAQIISIDRGKISLSIRRLQEDPWKHVSDKYKVGDVVEGTVLKINPFGAFVELDRDIHGLAHISELSWKKIQSPADVLKIGEKTKFKVVSIEPHHHRLGLSLKQLTEKPAGEKKEPASAATVTPAPAVSEVPAAAAVPVTPEPSNVPVVPVAAAVTEQAVATPVQPAAPEQPAAQQPTPASTETPAAQ